MTDIKQAWLDALRSGSYNQASGVLRQYGDLESDHEEIIGYCCLGVLQEVAYQVAEIELHQDDEKLDEIDFSRVLRPSAAYFAEYVENYVATSAKESIHYAGPIQDFLANKNDGTIIDNLVEQWNFRQIADWIEVNLENV